MSIAAVVLAAGLSTRLGRPKQSLVFSGETLVERAVRLATEAGLSPVFAVLLDADLIEPVQRLGAIALLNRKTFEGISTSIRSGVTAAKASNSSGVVLLTCDQIALTSAHLRALCDQPDTVTASGYAGRTGVPAFFPASSFEDLLKLEGDHGARHLLHHARTIQNPSLDHDIDTEEDVVRARQLIEKE